MRICSEFKKLARFTRFFPESFCDKNLAIRKVLAFCDSGGNVGDNGGDAIITRWVIWLIGVDEHEAVIG